MKKIHILLLLGLTMGWFACSDDDVEVFDVSTSDLKLSFSSYAGGAILHYTLPADPDIYGIKVRYENEFGEQVTRQGTYTTDSLDLSGFAYAQEQVPVDITLTNKEGIESDVKTEYFSTQVSPTVQMFEDIKVSPYWDGFRVIIPGIEDKRARNGRLNIYYLGTNPVTQELDTLYAFDWGAYPLQAYSDTLLFTEIKDSEIQDVTVVIKSEDNKGHFVRREVYENIATPHPVQLEPSDFEFSTNAETETKVGIEEEFHENYLFDGDTKGSTCLYGQVLSKHYTYRTKPNTEFDDEKNVFSINMDKERGLAWVRIYAPLNIRLRGTGYYVPTPFADYFFYAPSHVIVYGAPSADAPESEWVQLTEYYKDWRPYLDFDSEDYDGKLDFRNEWWWIRSSTHNYNEEVHVIEKQDAFEEAEPCYLQINCPLENDGKYKSFKIRVKETYSESEKEGEFVSNPGTYEKAGVIAMHELEIFVRGE